MLCPTRFVVDATENSKEGGVAAEVCRSQTGLRFCTLLLDIYGRGIRSTYDQIYIRKKKKRKPLRRSGLGMDMQNICAQFQGLSLKNDVDILTFVRKTCVVYVVACIYMVLG